MVETCSCMHVIYSCVRWLFVYSLFCKPTTR